MGGWYLGIGWEVGNTGTNLGQLAICSWTLEQETMWDLIFTRVTWEQTRNPGLVNQIVSSRLLSNTSGVDRWGRGCTDQLTARRNHLHLLPSCCSPCRVLWMRQAASPPWKSARPSWGQRAHGKVGRGGRSPEDTAEDTPHRTWMKTAAARGLPSASGHPHQHTHFRSLQCRHPLELLCSLLFLRASQQKVQLSLWWFC